MLDDQAHVEAVAIIRRLHQTPDDQIGHLAAAGWLREHHPEPETYMAALRARGEQAETEETRLMPDVQNDNCVYIQRGDHYDCLHCAGGRGVSLGACCDSCQERLLDGIVLLGNALDHHEDWCGHNADASGHSSRSVAADFRRWADEWVERHLSDFASRG